MRTFRNLKWRVLMAVVICSIVDLLSSPSECWITSMFSEFLQKNVLLSSSTQCAKNISPPSFNDLLQNVGDLLISLCMVVFPPLTPNQPTVFSPRAINPSCIDSHAQLVSLEFGPQTGVINKIYNLYHHALGQPQLIQHSGSRIVHWEGLSTYN